jgi:hypothetical protein
MCLQYEHKLVNADQVNNRFISENHMEHTNYILCEQNPRYHNVTGDGIHLPPRLKGLC